MVLDEKGRWVGGRRTEPCTFEFPAGPCHEVEAHWVHDPRKRDSHEYRPARAVRSASSADR